MLTPLYQGLLCKLAAGVHLDPRAVDLPRSQLCLEHGFAGRWASNKLLSDNNKQVKIGDQEFLGYLF